MNYYIPSFEEAMLICEANDNFTFFNTTHLINGFSVFIFTYRLSPKNFNEPLKHWSGYNADKHKHIKAHELRGLTFIFNTDGSLYKRFLLMNKFFNINQVEETLYDNIKHLEIENITSKEDGSIISFIQLPDGSIHAKTKASFANYQSDSAQNLFNINHNGLNHFIKWLLLNDLNGIFEFVSPDNLIVLEYKKDDLILLQIRNNVTGRYEVISSILERYTSETSHQINFTIAEYHNYSMSELMELAKSEKDIEGWIIKFIENDSNIDFVKQKTQWYFDKHSLYFRELNQENVILRMIIDDTIDDAISSMILDESKRIYVDNIIDVFNKELQRVVEDILKSLKDKHITDKKQVYIDNKNKDYITPMMQYFSSEHKSEVYLIHQLKLHYRKMYFKYKKAKEFLEKIGLKKERE